MRSSDSACRGLLGETARRRVEKSYSTLVLQRSVRASLAAWSSGS